MRQCCLGPAGKCLAAARGALQTHLLLQLPPVELDGCRGFTVLVPDLLMPDALSNISMELKSVLQKPKKNECEKEEIISPVM